MFQLLWSNPNKNKKISAFTENLNSDEYEIEKISYLFWEEHCIECAPLSRSSVCFHSKRIDNSCASFVNGIEKNDLINGIEGDGVQIEIKRWGKLETKWTFWPRMFSLKEFNKINLLLNTFQDITIFFYRVLRFIPKSYIILKISNSIINRIFKFIALEKKKKKVEVDGIFLEFYIEDNVNDNLILEIVENDRVVFKYRKFFKQGWNKEFINCKKIFSYNKNIGLCRIWVESEKQVKFFFKSLALVKLINKKLDLNKIKCVVFDLDNTLWEGIIGDDGDDVIIKKEVVSFIKELDERGIIISISSKNNFNVAWEKIKQMKLDEYFLCPQINWEPKSASLNKIALKLNISLDSLALIDDSEFEKNEVLHGSPDVRVYHPSEIKNLLFKEEFQIEITEQSKKRRLNYINNFQREKLFEEKDYKFEDFLINCEMKMKFYDTEDKFDRVYELLLRTNQFNTTGQKFEKEDFARYITINKNICWEITDKFGSYGVVGFISFKLYRKTMLIEQFVLSCRAAEKKVEETLINLFLTYKNKIETIEFNFIDTNKNAPIKRKLLELNFKKKIEKENILFLDEINKKITGKYIEIINSHLLEIKF
jgi:FkbH-like protein